MIRAKFMVTSKTAFAHGGGQVNLIPVMPSQADETHENRRFWSATPSGKIELQITNQDALDAFILGREMYVDFTVSE